MENIYADIAARTGGDIYIGVVGPVRTGKSTFIKRFMETSVIPNIENVYRRERARDELPQSGSGRTIMTAEPKFVPEEAVAVTMEGATTFQVRLIDCVGYIVKGAVGHLEGETERMVTTPWFEQPIPMAEAAEIGTILTYFSALSHRDLIPAFYEKSLTGVQFRDEDSGERLDIMLANIRMEPALVFEWCGMLKLIETSSQNNGEGLASKFEAMTKAMATTISRMYSKFVD